MLRYLKTIGLLALLFGFVCGYAQETKPVTLSVQQGHAAAIEHVAISSDFRFLASAGADHKCIIWDLRSGNQMLFTYVSGNITGLVFDGSSKVVIFLSSGALEFNIGDGAVKGITTQLRPKTKTPARVGDNLAELNSATVLLRDKGGRKLQSKTADYFDQPFLTVVASSKHKKVFVGCEDGNIYVYTNDLKSLGQYKGHSAGVNDLVVSADERYLFSVSSDRSIIQWDLKTGQQVDRFSGRSFPTYGVSVAADGNQIIFSDEIGFIKSINLNNPLLEIKSYRKSNHPITFTKLLHDSTLVYGGHENGLHIIYKNGEEKKVYIVKNSPKLMADNFYSNVMNYYRPPYSMFHDVSISPKENNLIYNGKIFGKMPPHLRLVDLKTGDISKKIFHKGHAQVSRVHFFSDSQFLTTDGKDSIRLWKIEDNNSKELFSRAFGGLSIKSALALDQTEAIVLSPDNSLHSLDLSTGATQKIEATDANQIFQIHASAFVFTGLDHSLHIIKKTKTGFEQAFELLGHQDTVTHVAYSPIRNWLISSSRDATIRFWDMTTGKLLLTAVPIGDKNVIYITPDNYYMTTGKNLNSFGFKVGEEYFFPEQFDPLFNRPDIVLERLQYADTALIKSYRQAYKKRLRKMGFTEDMLRTDFHLPELRLANSDEIQSISERDVLPLKLVLQDTKYPLDRVNVWINNVAVYGSKGLSLKDKNTQLHELLIDLKLHYGSNRIQISVMNQAGAESYKQTFDVTCTAGKTKPDLYVIALGESEYRDSRFNLTYAAKDAQDLSKAFQSSKSFANVKVKTLLNNEVTRENVMQLKSFLDKADINDQVILFYAGHGIIDHQLNYYLASYDMDFAHPSEKGIPYEEFESLLDGIAPLKKTMLVDACHSGEIDKEEVQIAQTKQPIQTGEIKFRTVGTSLTSNGHATSELAKTLFADLRKGTGATIISSAGGMEFAMESGEWKNGLFTYCLLKGLKSGEADMNREGKIMLSELQEYVGKHVTRLSKGKQKPTSRAENIHLDYPIW